MEQFTNEEKHRIDELYGNDFKGITPEDALLIGRWEANKAIMEDEHQKKMDLMRQESQAAIEQAREQAAYAMETLERCRDEALARLEAVSNG